MNITDYFEIPEKLLPDEVVSDTTHTIHNYKFRCVKSLVKVKNKETYQDRWFCLKEGAGQTLPTYIREGAKRTGFKTYNSFFAMLGFYNIQKDCSVIPVVDKFE